MLRAGTVRAGGGAGLCGRARRRCSQLRPGPAEADGGGALRRFRAGLAAGRAEDAMRAYEELPAAGRGAQWPRQDELRRFHVLARRAAEAAAAAAGADGRRRAAAAYGAVGRAIGDMRRLGMRVGATEVAAQVLALHRGGAHARALEAWADGVGRRGAAAAVTWLFPQTHQHAVAAAVALRHAGLVRDVYGTAMRAMDVALAAGAGRLQARRAPLLWALVPPEAEAGAEPAWDPARLGSAALALVAADARRWAAADARLLARLARARVRALFAEGRRDAAVRLYAEQRGRGLLCEAVAGLCRHSQLAWAQRLLAAAPRAERGLRAWNAYFAGLARAIGRCRRGPAADAALRRLDRAIAHMGAADGLAPDAATRAIWMRACFRAGRWDLAARCFRAGAAAAHAAAAAADPAWWDTFVRGMLGSDHAEAQRAGWQALDDLAVAPPRAADARLVETALHLVLRFVTAHYDPAYVPAAATVDRVFRWAKARVSPDRCRPFGVVIAAQLRAGRVDGALDMYRAMCARGLRPPPAVHCMVARALATAGATGDGDDNCAAAATAPTAAATAALAFVDAHVPPQHYAPVHLALLRAAVRRRSYADAWTILDRHYPLIADPPESPRPFPTTRMYRAALQATRDHGDLDQHRRVLSRLRTHLGLVAHCAHAAAMARVYAAYCAP
ncbi:hypothetical protein H4R18_000966 [Coemansia javaensis]|uniref:Pentatricopeptide repeat-containing protein n=1 Tax=Coemansia javaensis TaxID=2761396 RepID=A0A9W8HF52_9FUNG|nr:hypothetical protein H4R18_000966 [Coemansia javaensis]